MAIFEFEREEEWLAFVEVDARQFTLYEFDASQSRLIPFCHTEIAAIECAIEKSEVRDLVGSKITIVESTMIVFSGFQWFFGIVFRIENTIFNHDFLIKQFTKNT